MITIGRSRKGTKDPGNIEGRSSLAWWKFEGKARTNVSQDVLQGSTVTALKCCWKKKGQKKANIGKESWRDSGRVEIPRIQTTAGRGGKLIQGQQGMTGKHSVRAKQSMDQVFH